MAVTRAKVTPLDDRDVTVVHRSRPFKTMTDSQLLSRRLERLKEKSTKVEGTRGEILNGWCPTPGAPKVDPRKRFECHVCGSRAWMIDIILDPVTFKSRYYSICEAHESRGRTITLKQRNYPESGDLCTSRRSVSGPLQM